MTRSQLKALLPGMRSTPLPQQTPFCPGDSLLASFFDGHVDADERDRLLNHLSRCGYCRARLGGLAQLEGSLGCAPPDLLLARAKQLVAGQHHRGFRRRLSPLVPATAVAAALLMAFGVVFTMTPWDAGTKSVPAEDTRALRSRVQLPGRLDVLKPQGGAELRSETFEIRWRPVGGARFYEVSLMTEEGELLLQREVTSSSLSLNSEAIPETGQKYFVRVKAELDDGRTVTSPHVGFTVSPERGHGG